jgi:hypothetical protein
VRSQSRQGDKLSTATHMMSSDIVDRTQARTAESGRKLNGTIGSLAPR